MMSRKRSLALVAMMLVSIGESPLVIGEEIPSVNQMISSIARNEAILQNVSAKLVVTIPEKDKVFIDAEWGYSHGREYITGTMYVNIPGARDNVAQSFTFAFDGDKMWIYRQNPLVKQQHTGRIGSLETANFTGYGTLRTLLGQDVHASGRLSVSEALRQAKDVRVQPAMETINGHRCYVVEAIETRRSVPGVRKGLDVRLWVDPERDYRILRLDRYKSKPGPRRWKELRRRVDNIRLQRIDGVWIPVEGEFHNFSVRELPIPGMTKEEYKRMSVEEARQKLKYETKPLVPMRVITIDPESISLGKEISAEKFTIRWPEGTDIWDDFLQYGYRFGVDAPQIEETPELDKPRVPERSRNVDDGSTGRGHEQDTAHRTNDDQDSESATLPFTGESGSGSYSADRSWRVLIGLSMAIICCGLVAALVWKLRRRDAGAG